MKNPIRVFRNIILPAMILFPLIILLVGCIYIPTFDHTILSGTKQDFRKWAAEHAAQPQKLSGITRLNIESMFGTPAFISHDGKCVAYDMGSENGIAIWPLCFGAGFVNGKTHVLKLVYDDSGRLKRAIPLEGERTPPMYMFFQNAYGWTFSDPQWGAAYLLREANKNCPDDDVIQLPEPILLPQGQ